MKITLLVFAVVFLTASTFAQTSSHSSSTETNPTKSTVVSSSALSAETSTPVSPTVISTTPSSLPTTTSSSAPTTTSSSAPTTSSSSAPTTSSSSAPTTSSSSAPSTTPSTEPTTSSSAEPTTTPSTPPKTTTTPAPKTTTPHETTSAVPTSTTETPIPVPQPGYWNVTDGNTTCIRANMAIRFKIETNGDVEYIVLSPSASSEESKCNTSDGTEELFLRDNEYNVKFVFEKSSDNVFVKNITFSYYLPSSKETFTNDTHFFEVKAGSSYLCKTSTNVILGNATMEIISIQIQAFGAENNKDFGSTEECGADNPINDIVPIAVGVALLALVVVVLIAYLVGRRRSRQKGYQSV